MSYMRVFFFRLSFLKAFPIEFIKTSDDFGI
jgi:hypothetical protein